MPVQRLCFAKSCSCSVLLFIAAELDQGAFSECCVSPLLQHICTLPKSVTVCWVAGGLFGAKGQNSGIPVHAVLSWPGMLAVG